MRLTKAVREAMLLLNEGFKASTSYASKNHTYSRQYLVEGGKVIIREVGKTSWADSRYDKTWEASAAEVLYFLRKFAWEMEQP